MATILNTANTISVSITPGEDILRPNTSANSIFTFGDYSIQEPITNSIVDIDSYKYSTKGVSNFNSLSYGGYNINKVLQVQSNEINFNPAQPTSYAYFSSFYTKIATAINSITADYPYAILSKKFNIGNNITNISYDNFFDRTTLYIDELSLINQGNVLYKSGTTNSRNVFYDYSKFSLQVSGGTDVFPISSYNYDSVSQKLYFQVPGRVFTGNSTSNNVNIYIRPSVQDLAQFDNTISQLEYQLLYVGQFYVPDNNTNDLVLKTYLWPKTIDGFNPDSYGGYFDNFVESITSDSNQVDNEKTNIFLRAIVPDNLVDLDSETHIFKKLMYVYADEFDKIKKFIDVITYAHSIDYNREESVPNVFLQRLSNLLGAKLTDSFSNTEFFKYIAGGADSSGYTYREYNLDLWTKILVNINHLYKRKGTRDAIMFMFKLLGAPDCLIRFDEFVYKVTGENFAINSTSGTTQLSASVGNDGYPNINGNPNVFQAGGMGRGNGQDFIDFYEGAYTLQKTVDNFKVYTGMTSISSTTMSTTRDIINSKEVDIFLDAAQLIECDVKNWYSLGYGFWNWGSTGTCVSPYSVLPFSSLTVPFEYTLDEGTCSTLIPSNITAMTISEYVDYIYATFVDPRNRKVAKFYDYTTSVYPNLKKIYMNYMLWTGGFPSNRLVMKELEGMLEIIEKGFMTFGQQFIPSTTITNGPATVYRNTVFNRQKFVYKPGINDGSEFKKKLPPEVDPNIITQVITTQVNNIIKEEIITQEITAKVNDVFAPQVITNTFSTQVVPTLLAPALTSSVSAAILQPSTNTLSLYSNPATTTIMFPIQ